MLIHDDWGTQRDSFFSLEVLMEMIVPSLKKVVDYCHSLGMTFELHCCGHNHGNVPAMIAAGVDCWCGQANANDLDLLAEQYKDQPIYFGLIAPEIPEGASREEVREIARQWVLAHRDQHVSLTVWFDALNRDFFDAVYEFSRKLYAGENIA